MSPTLNRVLTVVGSKKNSFFCHACEYLGCVELDPTLDLLDDSAKPVFVKIDLSEGTKPLLEEFIALSDVVLLFVDPEDFAKEIFAFGRLHAGFSLVVVMAQGLRYTDSLGGPTQREWLRGLQENSVAIVEDRETGVNVMRYVSDWFSIPSARALETVSLAQFISHVQSLSRR